MNGYDARMHCTGEQPCAPSVMSVSNNSNF